MILLGDLEMKKPKLIVALYKHYVSALGLLGLAVMVGGTSTAQAAVSCNRTITADVVAFDTPMMFNRLGAQNPNFMMYALKRDVVDSNNVPLTEGGAQTPGQVKLRPDKRPRPLVLRVAEGDCLKVNFTNLLTPTANPFNPAQHPLLQINDQVAGRWASFHPLGLQLVGSIDDDGSYVGNNDNSLVPSGGYKEFTYYAEKEGAYMAYSYGAPFGGEASGGNVGVGLFGVVNVQPKGAKMYRSQITEEEQRLASAGKGTTATGQPIIDYEARYPSDCDSNGVWCQEGKAGLPILNMIDSTNNKLVHSDINAIIAGPNDDGSFPANTYPQGNPSLPNRLEAFREFTVVFHDETAAAQAFPLWFSDPVLIHTLHGVRDSFMINYGSGGIGSEIIANRLGVGPMYDCLTCAYEEFFLTAYTVGDPATLVDVPANTGLEACDPALNNCLAVGPKAKEAFYPADPNNVHHSYMNDFVKFRNLHAGPKEQHIFHLHNHQWLFNPNDDNSNYIDAQGIGPGSGYTYEINFGGSGNRNKSAGDAIFHCHFYPHFAQGMWEMWRIHDVTETGTLLEVSGGADSYHTGKFALQSGKPAAGARALPDGEIIAGTPIPAVVPLPGKPMAPMPGAVTVVPKVVNGVEVASVAKVLDRDINPGYPFWIAGIEDTVGQRPPTPPLDMLTEGEADALKASGDPLWANMSAIQAGGWDGGLPRHTLEGYSAGGVSVNTQNRLDFSKVITVARPKYFPETGTDLEKLAMKFHMNNHDSTALVLNGDPVAKTFETNALAPMPSAPFHEPCRDDTGKWFTQGTTGNFYDGIGGTSFTGTAQYGATNPRVYKGANIQIDAVLNKAGYHFPQQRIITLWDDVEPTINNQRPPEPFVIRLNTFDCAKYLHTNLVPEYYELDDYQVRTPTDIIGQHIHLPKWDLTSADGSGNGWNYEDGTLSPGMVQERIHAINAYNDTAANPVLPPASVDPNAPLKVDANGHLHELDHPYFGKFANPHWKGARTTIQRWFADPVMNLAGEDRGLGIIFTHDHYGPSTHQQVGLYATVLTEPAKSTWKHNETGVDMYTRHDGGPTSWQAQILSDTDGDQVADTGFREFYFEFGDFQHAYEKGVYVGIGPDGEPINKDPVTGKALQPPVGENGVFAPDGIGPNGAIAGTDTFRYSINPSFRQQPQGEPFPDILRFPPVCPGGVLRPCAEAISADDVGMLVVNYRNEPIGLRVYDPNLKGPDGKFGRQAEGLGGDLAYALQTRIDRAIPEFNTALGATPYPALNGGLNPGDPFTPMLRAYPNDVVKIKIQAGSTEHEHNATIHGVKWLQGGSGHGAAPNSGWRNAQNDGISEQFTFTMPVGNDKGAESGAHDYAYAVDSSQDGWWTGMWGILRSYDAKQLDLETLPGNPEPDPTRVANADQFDGVCPLDAPVREYTVVAMTANELLGNAVNATLVPNDSSATMHVGGQVDNAGGTLVYNPRPTTIRALQVVGENGELLNLGGQSGPLHDPTALLYVLAEDLQAVDPTERACKDRVDRKTGAITRLGVVNPQCPVELRPDAPVEPAVLRAAAGECVKVTLFNRLPSEAPDLAGYNTLLQVVNRDRLDPQGLTTFNNNLIRPSSHVGIHPQMVEYDVSKHDGANVGLNQVSTVSPVDATGDTPTEITYVWYAGHHETKAVEVDPNAKGKKPRADALTLVATPVEFGGFNLNPADKIKQGQKGLIGAGVILPQNSTWAETDTRRDHQQNADPTATRLTRTSATVTRDDESTLRDMVIVHQKGLNQRFGGDGSAVPNIASEGIGIPEDSHDAGQMAINYGTEPMWYRFGLPADAPFGLAGLGGVQNSHEAFSNVCCNSGGTSTTATAGVGDPVTPVFTATANDDVYMRVLMPTGSGRGTTFTVHGHLWQRDPYLAGAVPSQTIGDNPIGMYLGHQESVTPGAHFDVVLMNGAGGAANIDGDFLFHDQGSFGLTSGLWGILRVVGAPAQ